MATLQAVAHPGAARWRDPLRDSQKYLPCPALSTKETALAGWGLSEDLEADQALQLHSKATYLGKELT